jgi:hypothetical protein
VDELRCRVTPLWLPKAGQPEAEYEDACAPRRASEWDAGAGLWRCAVADGATEAADSAIWAKMLVRAYAAGALDPEAFAAGLAPLRARWAAAIAAAGAGRPLPWYLEEKRRAGAYAALVGLTLDACRRSWSALAVGDCCLFHLRAAELLYSFPLRAASDAGSRPVLIASRPARDVRRALRITAGDWQPGDVFLLASDALAVWFLRAWEQGGQPWPLPPALATAFGLGPDGRGASPGAARAAFAEWVAELRGARALRDDDVTLVCVQTDALAAAL